MEVGGVFWEGDTGNVPGVGIIGPLASGGNVAFGFGLGAAVDGVAAVAVGVGKDTCEVRGVEDVMVGASVEKVGGILAEVEGTGDGV
jgi:hypothetical protein